MNSNTILRKENPITALRRFSRSQPLQGQTAVIVQQDLENRVHPALILDNDLGLMRQPGHRFFFGLDEAEPIKEEA